MLKPKRKSNFIEVETDPEVWSLVSWDLPGHSLAKKKPRFPQRLWNSTPSKS